MSWTRACHTAEVAAGEFLAVEVDDEKLIIINLDGQFYAMADQCTHDFIPMSDGGAIDGTDFVCPWHGAKFCIKSGDATLPPAFDPVDTFTTRVDDEGWVDVELD